MAIDSCFRSGYGLRYFLPGGGRPDVFRQGVRASDGSRSGVVQAILRIGLLAVAGRAEARGGSCVLKVIRSLPIRSVRSAGRVPPTDIAPIARRPLASRMSLPAGNDHGVPHQG